MQRTVDGTPGPKKYREKILHNEAIIEDEIPVSSPDDYEKIYWNWLDEGYAEKLRRIRLAVIKLIKDCESTYPQLAGYTPHGPEHMERVEHIMHRLIPGQSVEKLKMRERFFLLAAAWLHDVGMLRGINGDHERDLSRFPDETIRREHHSRAEKFIVNHFSRLDVDHEDAQAMGLLALYHRRREPLEECPIEFPVANDTVKLRLLAAYVRLADSLDIDQSRSPSSEYAICISYNISANSKLHWIKSRLVSGICIEPGNHRIIVYFKQPHDSVLQDEMQKMRLSKKDIPVLLNNLDNLKEMIIDDLEEELSSVKNTLIRGSITHFLDIHERQTKMVIDDQIFPELLMLASNFDMISHPSATRLMYIVLVTVQRILQRHPSSEKAVEFMSLGGEKRQSGSECCENSEVIENASLHCNQKYKTLKKELHDFFEELECEVLQNRRCHLGLSILVGKLKKSLTEDSVIVFSRLVCKEKEKIDNERKGIRDSASTYFERFLFGFAVEKEAKKGGKSQLGGCKNQGYSDEFVINDESIFKLVQERIERKIARQYKDDTRGTSVGRIARERINIMVYGYSELVIKALCGFRDQVIKRTLQVMGEKEMIRVHKLDVEAEASDIFRIFVCEGQPKTITAPNDALDYHDGTRYASALARRGFTKVIILPDLVAGSLLQRSGSERIPQIHFVMFGANGLEFSVESKNQEGSSEGTDPVDLFRHSSGHLAIAALTKILTGNGIGVIPRLVLVIGSSKCASHQMKMRLNPEGESVYKGVIEEKNGYRFWSISSTESTRTDPFLVRDENVRQELYGQGIFLYNPREDAVPLSMVDDVILEFDCFNDLKNSKKLRKFKKKLSKRCEKIHGCENVV